MKQLSLAVLALAVFSLRPVASAQTPIPLITVDAVSVGAGSLTVTGIPQGQSAQATQRITFTSTASGESAAALEACHRQLLVALSKPGQYLVRGGTNVCQVVLATP